MQIGVPKEIKNQEGRVALTPAGAKRLCAAGHGVQVEEGAGLGSGFSDEDYRACGAALVSADRAWDAKLVLKVKEPLESEYRFLKDQILFTFLHLAGVPRSLTEALLANKTAALAYETLEDSRGGLPLLAPMSAVAGDVAITMGSYYLAKAHGGRGTLLGKVLGARHGKVVVLGDGVVGRHAARTADALGATTYIAGRHPERLEGLKHDTSDRVNFFLSSPEAIAGHLHDADLVVGAVLLRAARAPWVVSEAMVKAMPPGAVVVDVSIDQGGCIETSRPTSHSDPVYAKHGVIHYCVPNMPGAYPRTSTLALTTATMPYVCRLADRGLAAVRGDPGFARAVHTCNGYLSRKPVAEALGLMDSYRATEDLGL